MSTLPARSDVTDTQRWAQAREARLVAFGSKTSGLEVTSITMAGVAGAMCGQLHRLTRDGAIGPRWCERRASPVERDLLDAIRSATHLTEEHWLGLADRAETRAVWRKLRGATEALVKHWRDSAGSRGAGGDACAALEHAAHGWARSMEPSAEGTQSEALIQLAAAAAKAVALTSEDADTCRDAAGVAVKPEEPCCDPDYIGQFIALVRSNTAAGRATTNEDAEFLRPARIKQKISQWCQAAKRRLVGEEIVNTRSHEPRDLLTGRGYYLRSRA